MNLWQIALIFAVSAPGVVFGVLALLWLFGCTPSERVVSTLSAVTFSGGVVALAAIAGRLLFAGSPSVVVAFGNWFAVQNYHFPLVLIADRLSLPFLAMTVVLSGLVGQFSATYLHREPGFLRFFLLLQLFAFGSLLAFAAGSFDLLVAGWEFVGITSVLLIGFFQQRPAPVENGLRVFSIYRAVRHRIAGRRLRPPSLGPHRFFLTGVPALRGTHAEIVCLLLLLAAAGKAAQVPFSGWLPRAMEGPTPSSAIFYGAISIHAGVYLLLRLRPMLAHAPLAATLVILVGASTAIYGTIVGRASADAKTLLAYASLTQVGIVFVEIGFGWTFIAVAHILGHAVVRTLQFLRAPSMLHDYHQMHSAIGDDVSTAGKRFEDLVPEAAQLWLYRWALDRGHLDTLLDRWIIDPLLRLSRLFARVDSSRRPARQESE